MKFEIGYHSYSKDKDTFKTIEIEADGLRRVENKDGCISFYAYKERAVKSLFFNIRQEKVIGEFFHPAYVKAIEE